MWIVVTSCNELFKEAKAATHAYLVGLSRLDVFTKDLRSDWAHVHLELLFLVDIEGATGNTSQPEASKYPKQGHKHPSIPSHSLLEGPCTMVAMSVVPSSMATTG